MNYLYPCHNLPPNWSPISSPVLWTTWMPLVIGRITASQICPRPVLQNLWMCYVTEQQGLLQMWLRLRILTWEHLLVIQSGFDIITWTLKNGSIKKGFWMKVREIGKWRKGPREAMCLKEGGHEPRMQAAPRSWKSKEMDSPPERNTALPNTWY